MRFLPWRDSRPKLGAFSITPRASQGASHRPVPARRSAPFPCRAGTCITSSAGASTPVPVEDSPGSGRVFGSEPSGPAVDGQHRGQVLSCGPPADWPATGAMPVAETHPPTGRPGTRGVALLRASHGSPRGPRGVPNPEPSCLPEQRRDRAGLDTGDHRDEPVPRRHPRSRRRPLSRLVPARRRRHQARRSPP